MDVAANQLEAAQAVQAAVDASLQTWAASACASGRSTLFCCLSCGMPYSFPDNAYMDTDAEVRDVILFVHKIRNAVKRQDDNKKNTSQWQV